MLKKVLNYLGYENKAVFIARVVLLVSILALIICIFTPYAIVKDDYKEILEKYENDVVDQGTGFTGNDLMEMTLLEFVTLHSNDTTYAGSGLVVVFIISIIILVILTALLALAKKEILATISAVITTLLTLIISFDFTDRGVVGYRYDWSGAYYFHIVLLILLILSAVTIKIMTKISQSTPKDN